MYLMTPDVYSASGKMGTPALSNSGVISKAARMEAIPSHSVPSARFLPGHILSRFT